MWLKIYFFFSLKGRGVKPPQRLHQAFCRNYFTKGKRKLGGKRIGSCFYLKEGPGEFFRLDNKLFSPTLPYLPYKKKELVGSSSFSFPSVKPFRVQIIFMMANIKPSLRACSYFFIRTPSRLVPSLILMTTG